MEKGSGSDLKEYYEDFNAETEGEAKNVNKKTPTQGFYTSYTHFVSIPLVGEKIKENLQYFGVFNNLVAINLLARSPIKNRRRK